MFLVVIVNATWGMYGLDSFWEACCNCYVPDKQGVTSPFWLTKAPAASGSLSAAMLQSRHSRESRSLLAGKLVEPLFSLHWAHYSLLERIRRQCISMEPDRPHHTWRPVHQWNKRFPRPSFDQQCAVVFTFLTVLAMITTYTTYSITRWERISY